MMSGALRQTLMTTGGYADLAARFGATIPTERLETIAARDRPRDLASALFAVLPLRTDEHERHRDRRVGAVAPRVARAVLDDDVAGTQVRQLAAVELEPDLAVEHERVVERI